MSFVFFIKNIFYKSFYDKRGVVFYMTIIVLAFMSLIVFAISSLLLREIRNSSQESNGTLALFAAESGIERALYEIYRGDITASSNFCFGKINTSITPNAPYADALSCYSMECLGGCSSDGSVGFNLNVKDPPPTSLENGATYTFIIHSNGSAGCQETLCARSKGSYRGAHRSLAIEL